MQSIRATKAVSEPFGSVHAPKQLLLLILEWGRCRLLLRRQATRRLRPLDLLWIDRAFSVAPTRGAIHQLLSIILKLRILVLLPVSTMPYVVMVKNYS
jgi:hypothetical protein